MGEKENEGKKEEKRKEKRSKQGRGKYNYFVSLFNKGSYDHKENPQKNEEEYQKTSSDIVNTKFRKKYPSGINYKIKVNLPKY